MSHNTFTKKRSRTAVGVGVAAGAAFAALISLGTAHAIPVGSLPDADAYEDLFGAAGTPGVSAAQAANDATLDAQLFTSHPDLALSFDNNVDVFESSHDHPLENLIYALDPNAFAVQSDPDIVGTLVGLNAGDYLVPVSALGGLATELDYILTGTGLTFFLNPAIDFLAGAP